MLHLDVQDGSDAEVGDPHARAGEVSQHNLPGLGSVTVRALGRRVLPGSPGKRESSDGCANRPESSSPAGRVSPPISHWTTVPVMLRPL